MAGRTFVSQPTQIFRTEDYSDVLSSGVGLETGSTNLEYDLNALRSQVRRIIWAGSSGSWFDDVQTASLGGPQRGLTLLNNDLWDVEQHRFIVRTQKVSSSVSVPLFANYVVLSVTGSTAPANFAAVGNTSLTGTVVAELPGTAGSWSLSLVSGSSQLTPKNMVVVRDAGNGEKIQDAFNGNRDVYGLLQVEAGTANGAAFDDSTSQAQISFIVEVSGALQAASTSSIGGRLINYSYPTRYALDNLPEDAFLSNHIFIDLPTTSLNTGSSVQLSDITLQRAIDNQGSTIVSVTTSPVIDLNDQSWTFIEGQRTLLSVSTSSFSVDANQITLKSSGSISFIDSGSILSSYGGQPILFSSGTSDWNNFYTYFGPSATLLSALTELSQSVSSSVNYDIARAGVTTNLTANTNVSFPTNLDAPLIDYSTRDFVKKVKIYINGVLTVPALQSGVGDVYPGVSLTNGDFRFENKLRSGSIITMEVF